MPPSRKRPRIQNLALTDITQEFQLALPPRVKSVTWQTRQSVDVRMATVAGATLNVGGQYFTQKSDTILWEDTDLEMAQDVILYFRDPVNADTVIEALIWEEDR